ncbi:SPEG kinase, partial [Polypterus senegalus]
MRKAQVQMTLKKSGEESGWCRTAMAPPSPLIPSKRAKVFPDQVVPEMGGRRERPYQTAPVFIRKMKNAAVGTGCDIRLKVGVAGDPQPTLTWYRNESRIPTENQEYGGLWIKDCKLSDAGLYTCIATNPLGEARTSAVLAVMDLGEGDSERMMDTTPDTTPSSGRRGSRAESWAGSQNTVVEKETAGLSSRVTVSTQQDSYSKPSRQANGREPPGTQIRHLGVEPLIRASRANLSRPVWGSEESVSLASDYYGSTFSLYRGRTFSIPLSLSEDVLREDYGCQAAELEQKRDLGSLRYPSSRPQVLPPPSPKFGQRCSSTSLPGRSASAPLTPLTPRKKVITPVEYQDTVPGEFEEKIKQPKSSALSQTSTQESRPQTPLSEYSRKDLTLRPSPKLTRASSKIFEKVRYFEERRRSIDQPEGSISGRSWAGFHRARSFEQSDDERSRTGISRESSREDLREALRAEAAQRRSMFKQKASSFDDRPRYTHKIQDIENKFTEELQRIKKVVGKPQLGKSFSTDQIAHRSGRAPLKKLEPIPPQVIKKLQDRERIQQQQQEQPQQQQQQQQITQQPLNIRKPLVRSIATGDLSSENDGLVDSTAVSSATEKPSSIREQWGHISQREIHSVSLPLEPLQRRREDSPPPSFPATMIQTEETEHSVQWADLKPLIPITENEILKEEEAPLQACPVTDFERTLPVPSPGFYVLKQEEEEEMEIEPHESPMTPHSRLEIPKILIHPETTDRGSNLETKTKVKTVKEEKIQKVRGKSRPMSPDIESSDDSYVSAGEDILEAPLFEVPLRDMEAESGTEVLLKCIITGNPLPEEPAPDTRATLNVPLDIASPITSDDEYLSPLEEGVEFGFPAFRGPEAMKLPDISEVRFKEPPFFEVCLTDQAVLEGQDALFRVKVHGEPKPLIYWLRNRQTIKSGSHHSVTEGEDGTYELKILSTIKSDAGVYTCRAINEYGTQQCESKLDVKVEPSLAVIRQVRDVTVKAGETAVFECLITGPPDVDVDWLSNGKLIQPALLNCKMHFDGKRCKLLLNSVHEDDSGSYTCKLSTAKDELTSSGNLKVIPSIEPLFTRKLDILEVIEGRTARFDCKVSGTPPPALTWSHFEQTLEENENIRILKDHGLHSLIISHVSNENEGFYTVIAKNAHGETECSAELYVQEPRPAVSSQIAKLEKMPSIPEEPEVPESEVERFTMPDFVRPLQDLDVVEGKEAILKCKVAGLPYPTITWFHNGQKIDSTEDRKMMQYPNTLTYIIQCQTVGINQWTLLDANVKTTTYTVHSLSKGVLYIFRVLSATAKSHSKPSPPTEPVQLIDRANIIERVYQDANVKNSETYKLVSWSILVNKPDLYEMCMPDDDQHTLKIMQIGRSDVGEIVCIASNQYGSDTCTLSLNMAEPPTFESIMEDVDVSTGETSRFAVVVEGKPIPDILWHKNDTLLSESSHFTFVYDDSECSLVVLNTTEEDSGVYTCTAKNLAGSVYCKAELTVHAAKLEKEEEIEDEETLLRKMRRLTDFYDVHKEIGRGAFSYVKLVTERSGKVEYAAKFIPLRAKSKASALKELNILSQLDHERIVYFHDAFEKKNGVIIITEVCHEEFLEKITKKTSVLESEIRSFMRQILEGISYLHQNNILHLDIKPENILMADSTSEQIRICDFGNAKEVTPEDAQYCKYGTPEFVAPEIVNQTPVSKATDICLTGVSPFVGENDRATVLNIRNYNVAFEENMFEDLCREAKGFVIKLLVSDRLQYFTAAKRGYFASTVYIVVDGWGSCPVGTPGGWKNWERSSTSQEHEKVAAMVGVWATGIELRSSALWGPVATARGCLDGSEAMTLSKGKSISTEPLKLFQSRRKWQRSLINYKSKMVMRSIPELLDDSSTHVSIAVPKHLKEGSPPPSSSSDSEDIDELPFIPMPLTMEFSSSRMSLNEIPADDEMVGRPNGNLDVVGKESEGPVPMQCEPPFAKKEVTEVQGRGRSRKRATQDEDNQSSDEDISERPDHAKRPLRKGSSVESDKGEGSSKRGELRRGSSADSALLLHIKAEEGTTDGQTEEPKKGLKKALSMELPRRSPSPGTLDERRKLSHEDYALKLELMRQRLLRGGSVDKKMSGLREPLLETLRLAEDDPQKRSTSLERYTRPPRGSPVPPLARAASSDTPREVSLDPKVLRKSASFSQGDTEPIPLHRRLGAPLEIPLTQIEGKRLQECVSMSALTEQTKLDSRPSTPREISSKPPTPDREEIEGSMAETIKTSEKAGRTFEKAENTTLKVSKPYEVNVDKVKKLSESVKETVTSSEDMVGTPQEETDISKKVVIDTDVNDMTNKKAPIPAEKSNLVKEVSQKQVLIQSVIAPCVEPSYDEKLQMAKLPPEIIITKSSTVVPLEIDIKGPQNNVPLQATPSPTTKVSFSAPSARPSAYAEIMQAIVVPEHKNKGQEAKPETEISTTAHPAVFSRVASNEQTRKEPSPPKTPPPPALSQQISDQDPKHIIEDIASEEVFEAKFKRRESSLTRGLKLLTRSKSEEKSFILPPSSGEEIYRPGPTGAPLEFVKPEEPKKIEERAKSVQDLREAEKDTSFMRRLSLRLKGTPSTERKEVKSGEESPALEHSAPKRRLSWTLGRSSFRDKKEKEVEMIRMEPGAEKQSSQEVEIKESRKPNESPVLTMRKKIESTVAGISMRIRSHSEERKEEKKGEKETKQEKRTPLLSLLRRSNSEGTNLKRLGVPSNQLASQSHAAPSTESLQSESSVQSEAAVKTASESDRRSRWDRWGLTRSKREKGSSQPNIPSAIARENGTLDGHHYTRLASDFPPVFHIKLRDHVLLEGDPITLCCLPAGSPTPHIEWLKDKKPVEFDSRISIVSCPDGRQLLMIMKACKKDAGLYECVAKNPLASVTSSCLLSLARLPSRPGTPEIPQRYKNTALILWKPSDSRTPCTYTLERKTEGDSDWLTVTTGVADCYYNATELPMGSTLKFRVACVNKAGQGPYSNSSEKVQLDSPDMPKASPSPAVPKPASSIPPSVSKSKTLPASEVAPPEMPKPASPSIPQKPAADEIISSTAQMQIQPPAPVDSTVPVLYSAPSPVPVTSPSPVSTTVATSPTIKTTLTLTVTTPSLVAQPTTSPSPPPPVLPKPTTPVSLVTPISPVTAVTPPPLQSPSGVIGKPISSVPMYVPATLVQTPPTQVSSLTPPVVLVTSLSPVGEGPSTPSRITPTGRVTPSAKSVDSSTTALRQGVPQKPYTFMDERARGRYGVIRECKENATGKQFMAKIIPYEAESKQSVLQEYEILKSLRHEKVMALHEAYVTPRYLVLISESCVGKELLYSLIDRFRYSEDDVVGYIVQTLQGLEYLHNRRILHLDIKPDNIIVTYMNVVKIIDFGSAQTFNPLFLKQLSQHVGTLEFMSPEVIKGDVVGPPADIWGIGVLTYIMLSGRSPFLETNPLETENRIQTAKFDLTKIYPNVSQSASLFLKKILCSYPWARPTIKDCFANSWLQDAYLMKLRRQTLTFTTSRLKEFLVEYQRRRAEIATKHKVLLRSYQSTQQAPMSKAPPAKKVAPPPPGCTLDISDPQVQEAAIRIQASYRGHRSRKELREKGPPRILQELKDVVLLEGSAAKLECRVSAFPDPFIVWSKDGKELKDGPKYRYVFEDPDIVALVVRDGELSDLGQYTVSVKNAFGEAYDSARIIVEVPAKIEKGPDSVKAKKGSTVTLKAVISGEPAPDVGWVKNGEDIEEDDRVFYDIDDTSTTLTIKNVQASDAGKYEIFVENNLGVDQSFARVDIM